MSDLNAKVTGTLSAIGPSDIFKPTNDDGFNISLRGPFTATVQLERCLDGTNWEPLTALGTQIYVFTGPCSEPVGEPEYGVQYRLNCTAYTNGTISYRISQ